MENQNNHQELALLKSVMDERYIKTDKKLDEIIDCLNGNRISKDGGVIGQIEDHNKRINDLEVVVETHANTMSNWKGIAIGALAVGGMLGWALKELLTKH